MSKQPELHPVGPRRKIRPDEYERGKRDGADRKGAGNGQR
jgi:hypothetical protein